jgi:hypothetical protein
MAQYRKKPVVIEAWLFNGQDRYAWPDWLKWDQGVFYRLTDETEGVGTVHIPTLEGEMTAQRGDWIIKGIKGELYPCKPDIFEATYEAVDAA